MARRAARSGERRPLRDPRAREEPGLLAHRRRRPHARHRPERRGLHDAQEHGAQPARRRRRVGAARRHLRRDERRPSSPRSRIPTTSTSAITIARSRDSSGSSAFNRRSGQRPRRPPIWGELVTGNYFQVLGVRAAARPHAAAVGRDRAGPPSGRRHQRRSLAARLRRRSRHRRQDDRDQQLPADGRRRGRSRRSTARPWSTTSRCSFR